MKFKRGKPTHRCIPTPTLEQMERVVDQASKPMWCIFCASLVQPGVGVHGAMVPTDPEFNRFVGGRDAKLRVISWRSCEPCWDAIGGDDDRRQSRVKARIVELTEAAHSRSEKGEWS